MRHFYGDYLKHRAALLLVTAYGKKRQLDNNMIHHHPQYSGVVGCEPNRQRSSGEVNTPEQQRKTRAREAVVAPRG